MKRNRLPKRTAMISPFPVPPVRYWLIFPVLGGWQGRTVGIPEPDDASTEIGELRQVMAALTWPRAVRRGLPIVVSYQSYSGEVAA